MKKIVGAMFIWSSFSKTEKGEYGLRVIGKNNEFHVGFVWYQFSKSIFQRDSKTVSSNVNLSALTIIIIIRIGVCTIVD